MANEGVIAGIARQQWLDPVEQNLQKALHRVFGGGDRGQHVKNFLHGTWAGHPLHVILTDIPIGSWTAGMVFDLLDSIRGRRGFDTAADASIAIGVIGALASAVTGLTDWQDVDPPARRIGLLHAALNVGGVGLFAASLVARRRRSRGWGRALAALGFAVATSAARLGGNLVYEQRIGVDHSAGQELPGDFAAVLRDSELPEGTPKRALWNGTPILLVRQGGEIFALAETCSHLGGPLAEGKLVDNTIQCPWHASRFALDSGEVVDGPAVHPQPCLESRVRDGQIEVRRFSRERAAAESKPTPLLAQRGERGTGTGG